MSRGEEKSHGPGPSAGGRGRGRPRQDLDSTLGAGTKLALVGGALLRECGSRYKCLCEVRNWSARELSEARAAHRRA
jgi:hypothetical protein